MNITLLCGLVGGVLATAGITVTHWQFYVVLVAVYVSYSIGKGEQP